MEYNSIVDVNNACADRLNCLTLNCDDRISVSQLLQGANFNFDTAECTLLSGVCQAEEEMDVDKDVTYIQRIRKFLLVVTVFLWYRLVLRY